LLDSYIKIGKNKLNQNQDTIKDEFSNDVRQKIMDYVKVINSKLKTGKIRNKLFHEKKVYKLSLGLENIR